MEHDAHYPLCQWLRLGQQPGSGSQLQQPEQSGRPVHLAPGGPPPHSSVSGHPRRRSYGHWVTAAFASAVQATCCVVMCNPFTAAPALATARATSRVRRCQRMAEHPGTLDLPSCEAKSSGDGGPGSCPHGAGVGDLVGTRWRSKQGGGSLQCGGEERKVRRWKRERWGESGKRSGCWWKKTAQRRWNWWWTWSRSSCPSRSQRSRRSRARNVQGQDPRVI